MQETTHALNGWYVTGLCEGEACFYVGFALRKKLKVGIETRPSFSLSLNQKDLRLLQSVEAYFGCGGIRYSRSDRTYKYEVRSVRDLVRKIIPHFERYPLQGAKKEDFERFADICRKVHANLHLNREHLKQIIEIAYEMNRSGVRKHQKRDLLRVLGEEKG
jgi:hypothetical protein